MSPVTAIVSIQASGKAVAIYGRSSRYASPTIPVPVPSRRSSARPSTPPPPWQERARAPVGIQADRPRLRCPLLVGPPPRLYAEAERRGGALQGARIKPF